MVEDMGVVIGIVICEDGGSVVVFWLVVYVVDVDVEVVFNYYVVFFVVKLLWWGRNYG